MRKTIKSTMLVCVFAVSIFAGDIPNGGKAPCQPTPTTPCPSVFNQTESNNDKSFKDLIISLLSNLKFF